MEDISKQVEYSKELWMKEVELINRDVVVCCGTLSVVGFQPEVCDSSALYGDALGTRFVEFMHPMYCVIHKKISTRYVNQRT
ncbi:hypothetical protein [Sporosarcina sp. P7]|uniref:hypothetical protein n=1 Tax=Sporosarcina sp. P7 TaxID=2048244 RepID=UPI000C16D969|nr:hypothetical protein [Sporosarcina sp. P7]PID23622.1 hypothetical protein CSV60_13975 [Sporosarcina sp. P7]